MGQNTPAYHKYIAAGTQHFSKLLKYQNNLLPNDKWCSKLCMQYVVNFYNTSENSNCKLGVMWKLTVGTLKVVWAKFSNFKLGRFCYACPHLELRTQLRLCPVGLILSIYLTSATFLHRSLKRAVTPNIFFILYHYKKRL